MHFCIFDEGALPRPSSSRCICYCFACMPWGPISITNTQVSLSIMLVSPWFADRGEMADRASLRTKPVTIRRSLLAGKLEALRADPRCRRVCLEALQPCDSVVCYTYSPTDLYSFLPLLRLIIYLFSPPIRDTRLWSSRCVC